MKAQKTKSPAEIAVIIDRSGSMDMIREDAIGAFNAFLRKQQSEKDSAKLSLVLFDHEYSPLYWHRDLTEADRLDESSYQPRGTTALLDAIGRTLNTLRSEWAGQVPANVVIAILTDGYENASEEYSWQQVSALIADCREKLGWEFVFLAADQDAIQTASRVSIPTDDVACFARSSRGIHLAMDEMSYRVSEKRRGFRK